MALLRVRLVSEHGVLAYVTCVYFFVAEVSIPGLCIFLRWWRLVIYSIPTCLRPVPMTLQPHIAAPRFNVQCRQRWRPPPNPDTPPLSPLAPPWLCSNNKSPNNNIINRCGNDHDNSATMGKSRWGQWRRARWWLGVVHLYYCSILHCILYLIIEASLQKSYIFLPPSWNNRPVHRRPNLANFFTWLAGVDK